MVGWNSSAVQMDGYSDFCMVTPVSDETVAGICYARGVKQDLPPLWLIYIVVEDLGQSLAKCRDLGGAVIVDARPLAGGRFAVIKDPAGAVCAPFEAPGQ